MNFTKNILFLLFALLCFKYSKGQSIEYSVKAMYIEKIARFTDWNGETNSEYFVINVLGKSPFNGELEKIARKVKIKNKLVKINYINDYSDLKDCQVLFICSSEKTKISEIIKSIENLNLLTISDTPGFCKKGVHLNFYIDESETVKYEVNPLALKKSNLTIEMQLLSFGKVIKK